MYAEEILSALPQKKIIGRLPNNIKDIAIQVIDTEANSILGLKNLLTDNFAKVVELILKSKGNVVVSGIGKSANIAQKIVATLNSTGTTAVFMHAADAIHGDLGIIRDDDIVIIISKSGETPEIKVLTPLIKIRKNNGLYKASATRYPSTGTIVKTISDKLKK